MFRFGSVKKMDEEIVVEVGGLVVPNAEADLGSVGPVGRIRDRARAVVSNAMLLLVMAMRFLLVRESSHSLTLSHPNG